MNKRLRTALRIIPVFLLSGVLLVAATRPAAATVPGSNTLVSVNNFGNGQGASVLSDNSSISRDGRFVAFQSHASNLVAGDSNNLTDVFVRDLVDGTTERASVSSSEIGGNLNSQGAQISASGRYVVFNSVSSNLIDGLTLTGSGVSHIYLRDRQAGTTEMIDVSPLGDIGNATAGDIDAQAVSEDGRFVVFQSRATNLDAATGDSTARTKVFVRDRTLNTTKLLSRTSSGAVGNADSSRPSMSCDGAFIAFQSQASDLTASDANGHQTDIFLDERVGGDYLTNLTQSGTAASSLPRVSCNGSFVTFATSSRLEASDTDNQQDAYIYERIGGALARVNVSSSEEPANAPVFGTAHVSDDGRYAVFSSAATNLDSSATTGTYHIFMRDRQNGNTEVVSKNSTPAIGSADSYRPAINSTGAFVSYSSLATNLITSDTNGKQDVFRALTGN